MYERFTHQRCAFYWVPAPGSEEHRLLTPLLGRDILTGETVPQIVPEGLDPASWAAMTETAAHYGVHATLKAPFETKPGVTDDDLRAAGRRIAGRFSPIRTTPLELRYIPAGGGFLALTPEKTDAPLQALERACVSEPDSLRAPIGEADIARRGPLPEAQARYLRTWGYHLVFEFFRFHITLSGSFEDPDLLARSNADILHISPSHHYPTGIITPVSRRYELLAWALKSDSRYIIEDDYDSEFRLMGKPIPSMQSMDFSGKVIYINTFTKSLSSTIRISYMILPEHLLKKYYDTLSFYACTVSNFEQYTLAKFIQEGYFEKHINRMRNIYKNTRNVLLDSIKKSPLSSICSISEEDSGLHFLLKIDTELSDSYLIEKGKEYGLRLFFLSQYYYLPNDASSHTLVINYSGMDTGHAREYVKKLCLLFT